MTHTIDKLLEKAGFEADEIRQASFRDRLYIGIIAMLLLNIFFIFINVWPS